MGSVIAELALRSGFTHLTLVDGDTVEITNLNRQMFSNQDVGSYKAEVIAKRLLAINPNAEIDYINKFVSVDEKWHFDVVKNSDIIIDTIDISSIKAMLDIHRLARANDIPVIFPLNMGYSSGVFVFTSSSASLEQMLQIDEAIDLQAAEEMYINKSIFMKWADMCLPYLNRHNIEILEAFISRVPDEGWCPLPQIGIAAYMSAILCVTLMLKLLTGEEHKTAPFMYTCDPWELG